MPSLHSPRPTRALAVIAALAYLLVLNVGDGAEARTTASTATPRAAAMGAAQMGQWEAPFATTEVIVHTVEMNNGTLLGLALGSNQQYTFDPLTHVFTTVANAANLECSGQTLLSDGRAIVVGGGGLGPGIADVNIFNPQTQVWASVSPMHSPRWYPTAVKMPDGRILVVSGYVSSLSNIVPIPEIYDAHVDTWTQLPNASAILQLYPFLYVLSDGRVLHAGGSQFPTTTEVLDVNAQTWTSIDARTLDGGSSVMYAPNQIMKAGSSANAGVSDPSTATTYVLDMDSTSPAWVQTASMAYPRSFLNLTVLPDGKVLATGGETTKDPKIIANAVYPAELWDPNTMAWTTMASLQTPRLYHSVAALLPDARVLVAGGGTFTGAPDQRSAEIYSPPYLFAGTRPTISSAPTAAIPYNSTFFVGTPNGANIASVALIAPSAVTHSTNMNQRFISLPFSHTTGGLNILAPQTANLAPPGYYMLFIVDNNGVPSVAPFVRLPEPLPSGPSSVGGVAESPDLATLSAVPKTSAPSAQPWIGGAIVFALFITAGASWYVWRRQ